MAEPKMDNIVKLYTLLLLHSKPEHGYNIMRSIHDKMGKKASPGQIYPFLKLLQKQGYIKSFRPEEREKKVYRLTPKGGVFVKKLIDRFGGIISIALESSIKKCAHCGCEVYKGSFFRGGKSYCCESCAGSS